MGSTGVWAFDVDGTLVGSVMPDVLRPGATELLTELRARGVVTVVWSAGGADYARDTMRRHGIDGLFDGFYGKDSRDVDRRWDVGHFPVHHAPTLFVDDTPEDLPVGATVVAVSPFIGANPSDRWLLSILEERTLLP
jgi:phosphoglycolate phosphatase-like HAD superfamily hydrolase